MPLAGIVLGLGLGGFVDGITLHQIMQWHNMGSAVLPPTTMDAMAHNMVWDGMNCGNWFSALSTAEVAVCSNISPPTVTIGLGDSKSRRTIREPVTVTSARVSSSSAENTAGEWAATLPSIAATAAPTVTR